MMEKDKEEDMAYMIEQRQTKKEYEGAYNQLRAHYEDQQKMIGELNAKVAELSAANQYLDRKLADYEKCDTTMAEKVQQSIDKLTSLIQC